MFETYGYTKPLDDDTFDLWLQKGRDSKMGYQYLVIVWQVFEKEYKPIYLEHREDYFEIIDESNLYEKAVAVYDLYSESKVELQN